MRAQSMRQALRCENAKGGHCRCRCGGAFHGKARSQAEEYYRQLGEDDPHHVPEKKLGHKKRRQARLRAQLGMFPG